MNIDNPKIKVFFLWGIVVFAFFIYWLGHLYISKYQNFVEPRNYLVRAEYYLQQGDKKKALEEIEFGMETFRPVNSETLSFLMQINKDNMDKKTYNELEKRLKITEVLEKCNKEGNISFNIDILNDGGITYTALSKTTRGSITSLWKLLTRNNLRCFQGFNLSEIQIINLLYYSGGVFSWNATIGNTGTTVDDDIFVVSEGSERGSGAQIWFQGRNFGGHRRGFYVLILTPPPCKIYRSDRFDIWDSYNEAVKMCGFLEEVPEGYIGVFAVADEASENMTAKLEQMVLSFGFAKKTYNRRELQLFGYGYAFAGIGVKGAQEGTALQNWAEYNPSQDKIPLAVCGVLKGGKK